MHHGLVDWRCLVGLNPNRSQVLPLWSLFLGRADREGDTRGGRCRWRVFGEVRNLLKKSNLLGGGFNYFLF